VYKLDLTHNPT